MKHRAANWLIERIQRISPEKRRVWAAELFIWSAFGWVASHIAMAIWPDSPVFQVVVMAISWWAVLATCADMIFTTDVRAETGGD